MINKIKTSWMKWNSTQGHLPWYKRYEFLIASLLLVCIYFLFYVPDREEVTLLEWGQVLLVSFLFLFCAFIVLSDPEKPMYFKNILSVGILVLIFYIFFHFTDAKWDKVGDMFFNLEIMSKGSPFQTDSSSPGSNWLMMARGMWVAIKIFLISAVFSTLLGLIIAVVRSIINDKVLNFFLIAYVDIMRSIPILVMLIVVYSLLPYAGILLSPNVSGILTLVMVQGAYMSEVFRAGIEAINKQQIEASYTLGLSPFRTMRYVILPQALRIIIPPYTGYLVGLMKGTALCSQIAIFELLKSAYQIQSWYINATPLMIASGFYLVFLIPLTRLSNILEAKWKAGGSHRR